MLSTPYAMHDCETFMITRLVKKINQFRGSTFSLHTLNRILTFTKERRIKARRNLSLCRNDNLMVVKQQLTFLIPWTSKILILNLLCFNSYFYFHSNIVQMST